MDKELIRVDLLRRAAEMRELDPTKWSQKDPRFCTPGKECAIMAFPQYGQATRMLCVQAQQAVDDFMFQNHDKWGHYPDIIHYNDQVAKSPIDVAELLEKVAANL